MSDARIWAWRLTIAGLTAFWIHRMMAGGIRYMPLGGFFGGLGIMSSDLRRRLFFLPPKDRSSREASAPGPGTPPSADDDPNYGVRVILALIGVVIVFLLLFAVLGPGFTGSGY